MWLHFSLLSPIPFHFCVSSCYSFTQQVFTEYLVLDTEDAPVITSPAFLIPEAFGPVASKQLTWWHFHW